jgi:hypothetical protein
MSIEPIKQRLAFVRLTMSFLFLSIVGGFLGIYKTYSDVITGLLAAISIITFALIVLFGMVIYSHETLVHYMEFVEEREKNA